MTHTIQMAEQLEAGDEIEGWEGYRVVRYERHPSDPAVGRIQMLDRYGSPCWTPKAPDDQIVVTGRR